MKRHEEGGGGGGGGVWAKLRPAVSHAGLLVALIAYTVLGGQAFSALEAPQQELKLRRLHADASARREGLLRDLRLSPDAHRRQALADYEAALQRAFRGGVALPLEEGPPPAQWDPLQAVFFASTVLTTIGYGHMVPETFWGRVFCMLYALVGIPLTLSVIAAMGRLLASAVSSLASRVSPPPGPWRRLLVLRPPPRCRRPLTVLAALLALLLYLAAGSAIIRLWEEEWTFFDGFYFCFITMTTIGFGDVVPKKAEFVMPCTLYILAGLALTSTIIELVRRQYAQSWRRLQALSGPLAESLRRLGESAAAAGGGLDVAALHRMLAVVTVPKRGQQGPESARARADWEQAMAAVLSQMASASAPLGPDPRAAPVLQIVIYETTV